MFPMPMETQVPSGGAKPPRFSGEGGAPAGSGALRADFLKVLQQGLVPPPQEEGVSGGRSHTEAGTVPDTEKSVADPSAESKLSHSSTRAGLFSGLSHEARTDDSRDGVMDESLVLLLEEEWDENSNVGTARHAHRTTPIGVVRPAIPEDDEVPSTGNDSEDDASPPPNSAYAWPMDAKGLLNTTEARAPEESGLDARAFVSEAENSARHEFSERPLGSGDAPWTWAPLGARHTVLPVRTEPEAPSPPLGNKGRAAEPRWESGKSGSEADIPLAAEVRTARDDWQGERARPLSAQTELTGVSYSASSSPESDLQASVTTLQAAGATAGPIVEKPHKIPEVVRDLPTVPTTQKGHSEPSVALRLPGKAAALAPRAGRGGEQNSPEAHPAKDMRIAPQHGSFGIEHPLAVTLTSRVAEPTAESDADNSVWRDAALPPGPSSEHPSSGEDAAGLNSILAMRTGTSNASRDVAAGHRSDRAPGAPNQGMRAGPFQPSNVEKDAVAAEADRLIKSTKGYDAGAIRSEASDQSHQTLERSNSEVNVKVQTSETAHPDPSKRAPLVGEFVPGQNRPEKGRAISEIRNHDAARLERPAQRVLVKPPLLVDSPRSITSFAVTPTTTEAYMLPLERAAQSATLKNAAQLQGPNASIAAVQGPRHDTLNSSPTHGASFDASSRAPFPLIGDPSDDKKISGTREVPDELTDKAATYKSTAHRGESSEHIGSKSQAFPQPPVSADQPRLMAGARTRTASAGEQLQVAKAADRLSRRDDVLRQDLLSTSAPPEPAVARDQSSPQRGAVPSPIRQIAEAITVADGNRIDIRLEPEELGRVRIQMQLSEHGVALQLAADRPETLEMLRRHVDQLARYLSEAGVQSNNLSFSGERRGARTVPAAPQGEREGRSEARSGAIQPVPAPRLGSVGEMDLRL